MTLLLWMLVQYPLARSFMREPFQDGAIYVLGFNLLCDVDSSWMSHVEQDWNKLDELKALSRPDPGF